MTLNVYIDGFNLYKGALTPNDGVKWLDLKKFAQLQHPEAKLQDIFYFTARLKNLFPGDTSNERQHTYLRALEDSGIKIIRVFSMSGHDGNKFTVGRSKNLQILV